MGLQSDIGYRVPQANRVQRALHGFAAKPAVSPLLSRLVTRLDRAVYGVTRGTGSLTAGLVAFPTILLSTTGAKSGKVRTAPLSALPLGGGLALIGSNAGSGKVPGWAYNLRANPAASVSYRGRTVAVIAREASASEYEEAFDSAVRIYPGYAGYRQRATHHIPVFVLESKSGDT